MKKFISFAAFAMLMAATCMTFTACGDDDDDEGGKDNSKTSPAKYKVVDPKTEDVHNFMFYTSGDFSQDVAEGEQQVYYVVCQKSGGDTWYRPKNVTFTSTNEYVATVEKTGEGIVTLTAKNTGKTTLKASLPGSEGEISIAINVTGKKPKTADEARQMMVEKYWTTNDLDELPSDLTFKEKLSSDGKVWAYYTVKAYPESTTQWWRNYAGKTVCYKLGEYTLQPDKKDPTQGTFIYMEDGASESMTFKYRNLCATSFEQISADDLDDEEATWMLYTRTTAPSGVSNINNPWK